MANKDDGVISLLAKCKYYWRWLATFFSFILFGIGGILTSSILVPIFYLFSRDRLQREYRGQKLIHYSFRTFIWVMRFLGVLTYQVSGVEKLKKARLILANHPSLLDTVFLIAFVPNACCIIKGDLIQNPFMRGAVKLAGYIVNNEVTDEIINATAEAFEKDYTLIIFPEGTRTTSNCSIQLKRGAANIAIRTGVDITPVIIKCTPTTLTKEDPWYFIPDQCMHFQIKVNDKIDVSQYLDAEHLSKAARELTKDLSTYFNKEATFHE